jgi:hypothetical protein
MTFPSGTISADDIRYQLAYNNTAGAQTNVSLNDLPVRQAADKLTGAVSYNDLRSKNVFFSGTITWGYTYFSAYNQLWGLDPTSSTGSVATTSYCRFVSTTGAPAIIPNIYVVYDYDNDTIVTSIGVLYPQGAITPAPSNPLNVYIDGTKYAFDAPYTNPGAYGWQLGGDVLNLSARNGQTNQVVITY